MKNTRKATSNASQRYTLFWGAILNYVRVQLTRKGEMTIGFKAGRPLRFIRAAYPVSRYFRKPIRNCRPAR